MGGGVFIGGLHSEGGREGGNCTGHCFLLPLMEMEETERICHKLWTPFKFFSLTVIPAAVMGFKILQSFLCKSCFNTHDLSDIRQVTLGSC